MLSTARECECVFEWEREVNLYASDGVLGVAVVSSFQLCGQQ